MKFIAKCGPVSLTVIGVDLSKRDIKRLLMDVAAVAVTLGEDEPERPPMGFAAVVERAPDLEPESFFSDDDE